MFGLLRNSIKIRKPHLVVGEKIARGLIKNGLIIISVFSVSEKKNHVSKIFLNFHWDIAMSDTINVWYIFWKLVCCTNCKDSRIQKALDGFHSLPLNFNFELIDFWLCRRNIVFIVSDKFTRPIKLFLFEAWKVPKRIEKSSSTRWSLHWKIRVLLVPTTGAHYTWLESWKGSFMWKQFLDALVFLGYRS